MIVRTRTSESASTGDSVKFVAVDDEATQCDLGTKSGAGDAFNSGTLVGMQSLIVQDIRLISLIYYEKKHLRYSSKK